MAAPQPPNPSTAPEVDALLRLWTGAQARITERRSYEWKISISLWAIQLLAAKFAIEHRDALGLTNAPAVAKSFTVVAYAILVTLHGVFAIGYARQNILADRRTSLHFENEVLRRIGAPQPPPTTTGASQIATSFQIAITCFLAAGSLLLVFRGPAPQSAHPKAPANTSTTVATP